ncbi:MULTISPECIES: ATP-binding protein [unclassified Janibacter]|uniref:PAS domain-containing sensor histidine kinase n=1 Tax=unclassified Janibacter TaxID=2649294 RepID=UPI003D01CCCE
MIFSPEPTLGGPGLAEAVELMPDGLIIAGPDAIAHAVNSRAAQILLLSREEIIGQDVRVALPLHDVDGVNWWDVARPWSNHYNSRTGHREKMLLGPDGREVLLTMKYVRPGRGKPVRSVVLNLRDAAARRRAEADHAALISTVAHELRSPLTSVKGFSATLLRRWEQFTDDQKRLMIETIEADADRVTRLITELLDVSRIDSGRVRLHAQPLDLAAVFGGHRERALSQGECHSVSVEIEPGADTVRADPDRFDQVLANLIENGIRHGGGAIHLQSRPGTAPGTVDVVVSDEGVGIPAEHRHLAFARFWQTGGRSSTGLGLYIVKGLVEAQGGHIRIDERPGGGAAIVVTLPVASPD